MVKLLSILLFLSALSSPVSTAKTGMFVFTTSNAQVEGYLIGPGRPRALILYFHRAIEDREAVKEWASLLGAHGYAVAGYTAMPSADPLAIGAAAIQALRNRKELSGIPIVVMGASMGTRAAAGLFSADPKIRGMILLVPGGDNICDAFQKAAGRPVFLIQAQNDEVIGAEGASRIHSCFGKVGKYLLLPNTGHRFPPSLASSEIVRWLDTVFPVPQR